MIIDIVLIYGIGHGGVENVVTQVYRGLKNKGHRVRVFQSHKPYYTKWAENFDEIYYYGEPTPYYNLKNFYDYAKSYKKIIESLGKANIVLATHSTLSSYLCHLALKDDKNIPIISWIHGMPYVYGWEFLLDYCQGHLAISSAIKKSIKDTIKNNADVFFIGNPIENKNLKPIPRSLKTLKILHLSRLEKEKNTHSLLKALANVKGMWQLIVLGDGTLASQLKDFANNLGISNKITWLGWHEDPWNKIQDISLTVISSHYEGFCLSCAESLIRGIPVISTKCSGAEDMIKDGINGWLYEINDSNKLSEILNNIIAGIYLLPSQETCMKSMEIYNSDNVINDIEKILKIYVKRFNR